MELTRKAFIAGAGALGTLAVTVPALAEEAQDEAAEDATAPESVSTEILEYDIPGKVSLSELAGSLVRTDELTADEEVDCDVLVIGAGTAGVPAAISAAQTGANVVVLQKEEEANAQGSTMAYVTSDTSDISIARLVHDMRAFTDYRGKTELHEVWARNSNEAVLWAMDLLKQVAGDDAVVDLPATVFEYEDGTASVGVYTFPALGGVGGVIKTLAEGYADLMDIRYATPAVQLIKEDGRVVGAYAQDPDGKVVRVNAAKGVILATGDYQNNDAMVQKYVPDAMPFARKQHNKTGDGHLMGLLVGAKMQSTGHCKMIHSSIALNTTKDFQSTPFFAVNKNGERFHAEDLPYDLRNNVVLEQPGYCMFSIADSKDTALFGESDPITILDEKTSDQGVFKADTIEGLAEACGLPADALVASVDRYNELCETGDVDFGKSPECMIPLDTPPYYAMYREYMLSALTSGLEIDGEGRVLDADLNPIPGFYAVGNCSGPFYGCPDYPLDIPALSTSRCLTFGYVVGKAVASL